MELDDERASLRRQSNSQNWQQQGPSSVVGQPQSAAGIPIQTERCQSRVRRQWRNDGDTAMPTDSAFLHRTLAFFLEMRVN